MKKHRNSHVLLAAFLLMISAKIFAQNTGAVAYVSSSNKGFEKDVIKNLKKDARRSKVDLAIKSLDEFSKDSLAAYGKVAIIAYILDIKGPVLDKLRELQKTKPSKSAVWLTYTKTAPPLPEGIDAATSASKQSYAKYGYGQMIVPHLF